MNDLQLAVELGILDADKISSQVYNMKRRNILTLHPYSIWQGQNSFWYTRIKDTDGKMKLRKRKSKDELINFLVDFYEEQEKKVYVFDVFNELVETKLSYGEITKQSYDKYRSEFDRFFTPDKHLCRIQVGQITEADLEMFIKTTIRDLGLTKKAYSNLSLLLNGIFKYAKKKKLTEISITQFMGDLILPRSIFRKNLLKKELEVFAEEEVILVTSYLRAHPDIWNLGLLLQFETGLRIGELSALTCEDLYENYILISKTERKYKDESGRWKIEIQAYPKTMAGFREVLLSPKAKETIELIGCTDGYLFTNNGKRIRGNTFNKRLSSVCKILDIPVRSTHKVRKTYGTLLIDGNVDESIVAEQMGHNDISTTKKYYYFSNKNHNKKLSQISQVVSF